MLAPMAGYTDVGFRKLCAKFGAGLTFTEMISAKALIFNSKKTKELLLKELKSSRRIKDANIETLKKIIGNKKANIVYNYFHLNTNETSNTD